MSFNFDLPWMNINDYLMELSSEQSIEGLFQKALVNIHTLVPFDIACNLFDAFSRKCLKNIGVNDGFIPAYNNHFVTLNPILKLGIDQIKNIDWMDYQDTEFVTDLIFPYGGRYSVTYIFSAPLSLTVHRSTNGPPFTERDYEITRIITPHLNNIFSYLNTITKFKEQIFYTTEMAKECKLLSKREAEIAALLCHRLTSSEIATRFLISRRTVEFHIANIYEKLKVRNRRELILKLNRNKME